MATQASAIAEDISIQSASGPAKSLRDAASIFEIKYLMFLREWY